MKLKGLLTLLLTFGVVAAACSGNNGSADSSTTSSRSSSNTTADGVDGMTDENDGAGAGGAIITDYGVTDDTIRIGLNTDLSGIFAQLANQATAAQKVYFDRVNADGGIAGRRVELVILDNNYDTPTAVENYEELAQDSDQGVVMISQSAGAPQTAAILEQAREDNMVVLPLSWYSGWADPELGLIALETYTNYCVESMNGLTFLRDKLIDNGEDLTLAIISFPGEYGQDGAQGAKKAAAALGFEIVYDGEGKVVPQAGNRSVIGEIVESKANAVWATIDPATLGQIMGGAVANEFQGIWSGNSPTYDPQLLATDVGSALDQYYYHSTYTVLWNSADTGGMKEMVAAMTEAEPNLQVSDAYIFGWTEARITRAILEKASANRDMTRAGVQKASLEVNVDFEGLAPDQSWTGEPNDYIVRSSYIYDVSLANYKEVSLSEEGASTGLVPVDGYAPFASDVALAFNYEGPCIPPQS